MDWLAEFGGLTQVTASALLALVVIMILRGQIVPKVRLDEARQDRDAWRTAYDTEHEARIVAEQQMGERQRTQDLMARLIATLPPPGEGVRDGTQGSVPAP